MASNEEIRQGPRNRREGKSLNGYLVCNNCGGYYELQPGESWKDFDKECDCGGQFIQNITNFRSIFNLYHTLNQNHILFNAIRAASCSASFLLPPVPVP